MRSLSGLLAIALFLQSAAAPSYAQDPWPTFLEKQIVSQATPDGVLLISRDDRILPKDFIYRVRSLTGGEGLELVVFRKFGEAALEPEPLSFLRLPFSEVSGSKEAVALALSKSLGFLKGLRRISLVEREIDKATTRSKTRDSLLPVGIAAILLTFAGGYLASRPTSTKSQWLCSVVLVMVGSLLISSAASAGEPVAGVAEAGAMAREHGLYRESGRESEMDLLIGEFDRKLSRTLEVLGPSSEGWLDGPVSISDGVLASALLIAPLSLVLKLFLRHGGTGAGLTVLISGAIGALIGLLPALQATPLLKPEQIEALVDVEFDRLSANLRRAR